MVVGSRIRRLGSRVTRSTKRHVLGRIFANVTALLLGIHVYDTQCGAKLFTSDLAAKIFKDSFLSKWFFDVELFARTIGNYGRADSLRRIYELPLSEWHNQGDSKLTIQHYFNCPLDLMRIIRAYHDVLSLPNFTRRR